MSNKYKKDFLDLISDTLKKDKDFLSSALDFAIEIHSGQKRKSGEDYVIHPISVAFNLYKDYQDLELTAAALLHDAIEDGNGLNKKVLYNKFGNEVGFIVDAVTKTSLSYYKKNKVFTDKIEKTLWGGIKNVKVIILKIYDREHNLLDFENLSKYKQIRMSFETQAIFRPLKRILKLDKIKNISKIKKSLINFLDKNKVKNERRFKEYLIKECFSGLSSHMYDMIYKNSDCIVWVIEDKNFYGEVCKDENFMSSINILSLESDSVNFKVIFSFKKGIILNNKAKFKVLKYKKYDRDT